MRPVKNKEKVFLTLLLICIGYIIIDNDERTSAYLLHSIVLFLSVSFLFLSHALLLYYKLLKQQKFLKYILWLFLFVIILYPINSFLFANYFKDLVLLKDKTSDFDIVAEMFWSNTIFNILVMHLLFFSVLGIIYGFFSDLVLRKKFKLLRKITIYVFSFLVISIAVFTAKYRIDTSWNGNAQIRFIEQNISTLEELLSLPQFKNKVVYVDLWFSSCSPCIEEFKVLPAVKNQLNGEQVVYLYLASRTSPPNHEQLWKNAIKKYSLGGWHVYMNEKLRKNVWEIIHKNSDKKTQSYPHYLLINKESKIVSFNTVRPSEKEKLVREIRNLL